MKMNKKAQTTVSLPMLVAVSFVFVIILGVFAFFYQSVDESLSGNIMAGQVNASNASDQTIGRISDSFLSAADLLGIFFLFGVVFSIILTGFFSRNQTNKMLFMIDFIIILFSYVLATYISNSYETILAVLPFRSLIIANLANTSRFVLFLPVITIVTGFITMILTYGGIPRSRDDAEVAGF